VDSVIAGFSGIQKTVHLFVGFDTSLHLQDQNATYTSS
jgi:hypothetical protein